LGRCEGFGFESLRVQGIESKVGVGLWIGNGFGLWRAGGVVVCVALVTGLIGFMDYFVH